MLPTDLGELTEAIARYMSGADVVLLNFQSPEPCRVIKDGALARDRLPAVAVDGKTSRGARRA